MIKLIARTCRHVLGVRLSSGAGSRPFSFPSTVIELDAARGMEVSYLAASEEDLHGPATGFCHMAS